MIGRRASGMTAARIAAVVFGCVLAVGCVDDEGVIEGADPDLVTAVGGMSPLEQELADAAEEFAVPRSLLEALGYTQTRWWTPDPDAIGHGDIPTLGVGIMQLPRRADHDLAATAADALGVSVETLATERAENIRAAAWFLSQTAFEALGRAPDTLEDFWTATARYASGPLDDPEAERLGRAFANEVFGVLARGASVVTEEGKPLTIAAHPWLAPDVSVEADELQTRELAARPDYPSARWSAAHSSNYTNASRRASDISHITIHVVQGSYAGAISWFRNPSANVAAHYVIRSSDGAVTQMVEEADIGWHVAYHNGYTVGIEHEGWVDNPAWFTDAMYRSSADLVRNIAARQGIPLNRTHIKGHVEFPRQTHTDPGRHWNWDRYMGYVTGGGGSTDPKGNLVGFIRAEDLYDTEAGIAGARVRLNTGEETTTAGNGFYRFNNLDMGSYRVTASKDGYETASRDRTLEVVGGDTWASLALTRAAEPERCDDGVDNDRDGATDCDDSDCHRDRACPVAEVCDNGFDDDFDGAEDCDDDDCYRVRACPVAEVCDNDFDDDFDGAEDCADDDCHGVGACPGDGEVCDDGWDNDGDGLADCEDPDCAGADGACGSGTETRCDDGVDDDSDRLTDCEDPDCLTHAACATSSDREWCNDGLDNDGDGLADCDDSDCSETDRCRDLAGEPRDPDSGDDPPDDEPTEDDPDDGTASDPGGDDTPPATSDDDRSAGDDSADDGGRSRSRGSDSSSTDTDAVERSVHTSTTGCSAAPSSPSGAPAALAVFLVSLAVTRRRR